MRNGIDASKVTRRMAGESARRKGLAMRSSDVRSSTDDVEWISLGRSTSLRAVMRDKTRGMSENSRKPTVSPHVGSWSPSHIKLPTKAQIAEMKSVAGINSEVATMTGLTNIRKRKICTYATAALRNVRIVSSGMVCRRVVYGTGPRDLPGFRRKRSRIEKKRHMAAPVHQTIVHEESLNFRRERDGRCGSGSENTSMGRVVPSLGSSDSVKERDTGSWLCRGGGGGGVFNRVSRGALHLAKDPGESRDDEDDEGDGERGRRGGDAWCANHPFGKSCDSAWS